MENIEVIGIDHGWSSCKTNNFVFVSGVHEITTEPAIFDNVLEFGNKYYKIGGERLKVKDTKVEDDNYYLLTLAGIAKELKQRGKKSATIILAVGLPLTRFGAEKSDFIHYLSRTKEVSFLFEQEKYKVVIEKVVVYPQCYGAVVDRLNRFPEKGIAIDLGSWTLDVMPIINKNPDESMCVTFQEGVITCIQQINKECVRQLNGEMDEIQIEQFLINGGGNIPMKYQKIIVSEVRKYCGEIFNHIRELGYNLDLMPMIFVGGGASIMKRFGGIEQSNIQFMEDVKANAIGFEKLGKAYLSALKKQKAG